MNEEERKEHTFDLEEMWTKGMLGMMKGNNKEIYCLISTDL